MPDRRPKVMSDISNLTDNASPATFVAGFFLLKPEKVLTNLKTVL